MTPTTVSRPFYSLLTGPAMAWPVVFLPASAYAFRLIGRGDELTIFLSQDLFLPLAADPLRADHRLVRQAKLAHEWAHASRSQVRMFS